MVSAWLQPIGVIGKMKIKATNEYPDPLRITQENYLLKKLEERQLLETDYSGTNSRHVPTDKGNAQEASDVHTDVHARDRKGRTALMLAVARDDIEAIAQLLNQGSDVNARDDYGWTPLLIAVHKSKNPKIVDLLLSSGADIALVNDAGNNVLFYVKMNGYLKGSEVYKRMLLAVPSQKEEPLKDSGISSEFHAEENQEAGEQTRLHRDSIEETDKNVPKSFVERFLSWFSSED